MPGSCTTTRERTSLLLGLQIRCSSWGQTLDLGDLPDFWYHHKTGWRPTQLRQHGHKDKLGQFFLLNAKMGYSWCEICPGAPSRLSAETDNKPHLLEYQSNALKYLCKFLVKYISTLLLLLSTTELSFVHSKKGIVGWGNISLQSFLQCFNWWPQTLNIG